MQIVGYINTNKDYLHGQKMKYFFIVFNNCRDNISYRDKYVIVHKLFYDFALTEALSLCRMTNKDILDGKQERVGSGELWLIKCVCTYVIRPG